MVKAVALLTAAVLMAGCAMRDRNAAVPRHSIVGAWAIKDPLPADHQYDETDCGTDFAVRYGADGTYTGYDERGRWSQAGDTITEVVTHELGATEDIVSEDMVAIAPRTQTYRLRWLSPNQFNAEGEGGINGMIRCPPLP